MADTVRRVEYHYLTVPDSPGEGRRILSMLEESGVDLLAFLGFPVGSGQSRLDLVPDDPGSLRAAAERAGITLSEAKRAFLIQGDDRVGAVADRRRSSRRRTSGSRLRRRPAPARGATG